MNVSKMREALADVSYRNWRIDVSETTYGQAFLQVVFTGACSVTEAAFQVQKGRKWMLSEHMTKSELVGTAFKAVLTAEEHEVREHFKYRGQAIFGPHLHVDMLWGACDAAGKYGLDVRASDGLSLERFAAHNGALAARSALKRPSVGHDDHD